MSNTENEKKVETRLHFTQNGEHRTLGVNGFFDQQTALQELKRQGFEMDDDRLLLTYNVSD